MSVRPIKSPQRYLSLDLTACMGVCPDWLLVFFELLRQQKIQSLTTGDMIDIRKPVWDAAGVITSDRRKKVLNHLERVFLADVVSFRRRRGSVPIAILGTKMAEFHSKSGFAVTTASVALNKIGYLGKVPKRLPDNIGE